jgi:hypothetical protein
MINPRRMRLVEYRAWTEKMRNTCNILVRKSEERRQFGRHMDRWKDNIKMDLKEIRCENRAWIRLVQDRVQ